MYYDAVSRVCRDPTELYGFILKSVPYLILRDRTKRESYYYSSTQDFTADELIPSESFHVTVCHSSRTNNSLQNQTIFRRNSFLSNIRCPFVKNISIPDRVQNKNLNSPKTYTYYYGENHTLQNLLKLLKLLKL